MLERVNLVLKGRRKRLTIDHNNSLTKPIPFPLEVSIQYEESVIVIIELDKFVKTVFGWILFTKVNKFPFN